MVRNYIKKGGHGGRRRGQGLPAQHWEAQGGRKAAAEAKAQRKAEANAKVVEKKRTAAEWWQAWAAPSSKQQEHSSEPAAVVDASS